MTLNVKIGVLKKYFGDFGLRDTFQEQIARKPIEIVLEKLHLKILALKVDFEGPSLCFLG